MAWWRRLLPSKLLQNPNHHTRTRTRPLQLQLQPLFLFFFSTSSFLITKIPKKHKLRRPKPASPRTRPVQPVSIRIPHLESILERDSYFRFLTKSKEFLAKQPDQVLRLADAGKLYRELGFARGRKIAKYLVRHPLIFTTYRHTDGKMWLGFSDLMDQLISEERSIMDQMEEDRVTKVRKLLMMTKNKRILLSKIYHSRLLFGIPEDFRERIEKYPDYFRIVVENDGRRMLELVKWDPGLAVSALQEEFVLDEDKVKKAFRFPVKYGRDLDLEVDDVRKLNLLNTLPLVSPYSDGWKLDVWSLEAEKYRVGILHELLSLTLEKRAMIHHIVEFRDEFSLTRQTYDMLKKQPRTFYLAGTEMNWAVFLKDSYDANGVLIHKDPQVRFNERLRGYAHMRESDMVSVDAQD